MSHILLVDDDERILDAVRLILEHQGHSLVIARSGPEALHLLETQHFDLCVLDIIMPEMSGLEVIRRIRALPYIARIPILVLSAKGRSPDMVEGLDAGADDYLTKPFEVVELPARIRALLRRAPGGALDTAIDYLTAGELQLHIVRPEVRVGSQVIEVTALEHQLLSYLMRSPGKPIPVNRLLEDIWAYPPGAGNPNIVQVHITNLRNKLARAFGHRYIRNVRGQGYTIDR